MSTPRWDISKTNCQTKTWLLDLSNPSDMNPYSISDLLTAELLKGANESDNSLSEGSSQAHTGLARDTITGKTELSVSVPVLDPLSNSYYFPQSPKDKGSKNECVDNFQSSINSFDGTKYCLKLNQIPERSSEFTLEQIVVTGSEGTRQISDLMGSQATIFSTKGDLSSPSRLSKGRLKSVKAGVDYAADGYNSLHRRGAIRFRPESRVYRIYARMRRLASFFKKRFSLTWEFVVRSKRTNATTQVSRLKSQSLRRRPKTMKKIREGISGPINNLRLGHVDGAERVSFLNEDVQALAGMIRKRQLSGHPFHENKGKLSHLSLYIKEQRDMTPQFAPSRDASPPSHCHAAAAYQNDPKLRGALNSKLNFDGVENLDLHNVSLPDEPSSSPHSMMQTQALDEAGISLWRSWLSNVTALRIRLRQEIALFQALAAGKAIPPFFTRDASVKPTIPENDLQASQRNGTLVKRERLSGSKSSTASYIMSQRANILEYSQRRFDETPPEQLSDSSIIAPAITCKSPVEHGEPGSAYSLARGSSVYSTQRSTKDSISQATTLSMTYKDSSDTQTLDENVSKLQKVLNRRSMLGDMLDYDSDGTSTVISLCSQNTVDTVLMKRYGTILTTHGGARFLSRDPSIYSQNAAPALARSPGFNSKLNLVA